MATYKPSVAGAQSNSRTNYRYICDLLESLCENLIGNKKSHKKILKHATQYLSNCPTALGSTLPYDEASLVVKITHQLKSLTTPSAKSLKNEALFEKSSTQSFTFLFLNMHEQLKASQLDTRLRSSMLTFLYYLSNTKYSNDNGFTQYLSCLNRKEKQSPSKVVSSLSTKGSIGIVETKLSSVPEKTIPTVYEENTLSILRAPVDDKDLRQRLNTVSLSSGTSRFGLTQANAVHGHEDISERIEFNVKLNDDIVQNVIYSFTGIEGKFLKKDANTGQFKLDPTAKSLNVVQAGMLLRLSELGYYHDLLQNFSNKKGGNCALGLMGQGLVSSLKNELTKFYGMVANLQEQLNKQREIEYNSFSKSISPAVEIERLTLMKLLVWTLDPLQRLQWLAEIAEECQAKKGGALASTIHSYLNNGSPVVKSIAKELLLAVCGPMLLMLSRWLLEGELFDPNGEFFIECRQDVGADRLWHDKYQVRLGMLPNFISLELANKILVAGKSINFLYEICEDKYPVKGREELRKCIEVKAEDIFSMVPDTKMHSTIDAIYLNTSKRMLDLVMGPHKLLEHMQAMRRYLLLGQGDFISILIEQLKKKLDKPAKDLYTHDLSSIMDVAIRSTNAQFEDPEILNHLDVRLLTPCDGDVGWDILSLQYTVRGPLSTILEPSMNVYQVMFKPLWRMKHMEFVLSSKIWKDQKSNAKILRPLTCELNKILYRLHLFTSEMIHFIYQMQYYILFEVIECSWAALQEQIHQAKALDDILTAHNEFLDSIRCGAFLDASSGDICQHMESIYEAILRLELWQDKFYDTCFSELESRTQYRKDIEESEKSGKFSITTEKQHKRDHEYKLFEQIMSSYQKTLENIGADYEKAVRNFLLALNSNNDPNLQLFGTRLDFNEYYKKRDQSLAEPLTFVRMRLSNVFFNNTNKSMVTSRSSISNL